MDIKEALFEPAHGVAALVAEWQPYERLELPFGTVMCFLGDDEQPEQMEQAGWLNVAVLRPDGTWLAAPLASWAGIDHSVCVGVSARNDGLISVFHFRGYATILRADDLSFVRQDFTK